MLPRPGPDSSEQPAIQPCPSQIVQQAGDLILPDARCGVAEPQSRHRAHARGAIRMRPIVSADDAAWLAWVGIVVETQEFGREGTGNEERDWV